MIFLNNNFFSDLDRNKNRYVKEKLYFFENIIPRISELVNNGTLEDFKINLSENPLDEEDYFTFVRSTACDDILEFYGVTYKGKSDSEKEYYTKIVEVTKDDGTKEKKIISNWNELLPALSDKKFKYLQEVLSEFFENINFKYIKGAERAFKSNGRFNDMFGIFKHDCDHSTVYTLRGEKENGVLDSEVTYYNCKCKCKN